MDASLVMALHSHLPYVMGQSVWPHGETWIYEAAADSYLPLLVACRELNETGIRPAFTVEISPILGEQLDEDRCKDGLARFLEGNVAAAKIDATRFAAEGNSHGAALADGWVQHFMGLIEDFDAVDRDIVGSFGRLDAANQIELFTSARSHGLLPLLGSADRVSAQVEQGVDWFRGRFGRAPVGMWMPECAYRPGGAWTAADGSKSEPLRPGVESFLEAAGVQWTIVDTHLVTGGPPIGSYEVLEVEDTPTARSPYTVYRIADSAVTALARDPHTATQVWSGEYGYPGDPAYREFHKSHDNSGLRYWRITEGRPDLGGKDWYRPESARGRVRDHAAHFVSVVEDVARRARNSGVEHPVITAPYDTELFGHWWSEGIEWLTETRRCMEGSGIEMTTATDAVAGKTPAPRASLPAGSWGSGGEFAVWRTADTAWMWSAVYEAEALLASVDGVESDLVRQLERTVLLIESSDWEFLVTSGAAADYATERVSRHLADARALVAAADDPTELQQLLTIIQTRDNT